MDNISKLYTYNFLTQLSFVGAVSVPFFLDWGKLSYTALFFLQSWFLIWIFVLEVPTGTFADRYGRKLTLFISSLVSAVGAFAYSLAPNFLLFMAAEFLLALGIALLSGADKAMLYDSLKYMRKTKQSMHFFSRYAFSGTLALVVAFPLGSIIAGSRIVPYPQILALTFALTAVPVFISALVALTMKEPARTRPKENFLNTGIKGIKYLKRHKILRSFAIDMTFVSATTFFIFWLFQPLLLNAHVNIIYLGFVSASFNLLAALLLFKARWIGQKFGIKRILFMTAFLPALAFIGLSVYHEIWFILTGIFIIASLRLFRQPLFDSYMNKFIRSGDRATVLSAVSMMQRIITILLYPVIGFLSDISLNYALALLGFITLVFAFAAKVDARHL